MTNLGKSFPLHFIESSLKQNTVLKTSHLTTTTILPTNKLIDLSGCAKNGRDGANFIEV